MESVTSRLMNRFWSWLERLIHRKKLKDKRSPKQRLDKKWMEFWSHEAVYGVIVWLTTVLFAEVYKATNGNK